jgi:hypothetical protein
MLRSVSTDLPRLRIIALIGFALVGLVLVRSSRGTLSVQWMRMYFPPDIPDWPSLVEFIAGLRVPIPPLVAAAEVLNWNLVGNAEFMQVWVYRGALVGSFLLAIHLASTSRARLVLATAISIV